MALVIEDGTQVLGANSYVTGTELATYGTARGITFTGDKEVLLTEAMTYLESLNYKGDKLTKAQPLQFPRTSLMIDGFYIDIDEIPQLLKDLQCEVAIAIGDGESPLITVGRAVKREKVDVIEVEYMDSAMPYDFNRKIGALEKKLVRGGGLSVGAVRG